MPDAYDDRQEALRRHSRKPIRNDRFDAILGMDVLERFDFAFGRSGEFEMMLN